MALKTKVHGEKIATRFAPLCLSLAPLCMQLVAAQAAYLHNVQSNLGGYLRDLELHRQSQQEVKALSAEIARLRSERKRTDADEIKRLAALHVGEVRLPLFHP